jgi:hypothetical protein
VDPTFSFSDLVKWVAAAGVAVLTWFTRRLVATQDDHGKAIRTLEADKVARDEHEKAIDRLEAALREHRQETIQQFNRVLERLDTIADRVQK